ncbi:hypothetical protein JCM21900_001624 [Sporobolomyces salmonicolor]
MSDRLPLKDLPSIYPLLPRVPSVPVSFRTTRTSKHDRRDLDLAERLISHGPASVVLTDLLKNELKHELDKRKAARVSRRSAQKYAKDHAREPPAGDAGVPKPRRKTGRPRKYSFSSDEMEGDDERGVETDAASVRRAKKHKHLDDDKRQAALQVPEVEIPPIDLPEDFPSGDLLTALHTRTATLFTSTYHLLPPLSTFNPVHSPEVIAHFDALEAELNQQEEELGKQATAEQWNALKKGRLNAAWPGARRGAWVDGERAFDASALIALGMLSQLLAEDVVQRPSEDTPPEPTGCPGQFAEDEDANEDIEHLDVPYPPIAGPSGQFGDMSEDE